MLNLSVLFPDYLDESKTATIEMLENMQMPESALETQVDLAGIRLRNPILTAS